MSIVYSWIAKLTEWQDFVGVWVGTFTMILVLITWFEVRYGRKRQLSRLFQSAVAQHGEWPVILIANFLSSNKPMRPDVEKFRQSVDSLKSINANRIFEVKIAGAAVTPDAIPQVIDDIRRTIADISNTGADVIHLFYGGPHVVASLLGKELANSHKVLLYQQDMETKRYVNFGPLSHRSI